MMNRKNWFWIVIFVLLLSAFLLTACSSDNDTSSSTTDTSLGGEESSVYVVSMSVDTDTVPSVVYAGNVPFNEIQLVVTKSDGMIERVNLTEDMISVDSRNNLSRIGTFNFTVIYSDCQDTFMMTLRDPSLANYSLVIYGGLPKTVNGQAVFVRSDDDGVFRATYPVGTEVIIDWTQEENKSFVSWEADGATIDNQASTKVIMYNNHVYVAHSTEIVYTVKFQTNKTNFDVADKQVKKLYPSTSLIYDKTDVYADALPAISMDGYVFSGWTTTPVTEAQALSGENVNSYEYISFLSYETIASIQNVLTFTLNGVTYYYDTSTKIYSDSKKQELVRDSYIDAYNRTLAMGDSRYSYRNETLYDEKDNIVGTIVDTFTFTHKDITYYFDINSNFYYDQLKTNKVSNCTYFYENEHVYDMAYYFHTIDKDITLYGIWTPLNLASQSFTNNETREDGCEINGYSGNIVDLVIPETLNGLKVLSISKTAFMSEKAKHLTSITIPATVINIDEGAFQYCSSLQAIYVKEGSQYFSSENGVLYKSERSILIAYPANKITRQYTLESNVTKVCDYALYNALIGKVILPTDVSSIGNHAFDSVHIDTIDFSNLASTKLSSAKSYIGDDVFSDKLSAIIVNNESAVSDYKVLKCFKDATNKISTTGGHAVYVYTIDSTENISVLFRLINYTNLAPYFKNKNTTAEIIGVSRKVTSINLPNKITAGNLSYSVSSLGYYAFKDCIDLTEVTHFPSDLERICDKVFDDTPWIKNTVGGFIINDCIVANSILYKYIGDSDECLLSGGIIQIAEGAFAGNEKIKFINTSDNSTLQTISALAFQNCTSLSNFSNEPESYTYQIKKSLVSIGDYAFYKTKIRYITAEKGSELTSIGAYTFSGCEYLKEFSFDSANLNEIDMTSFFGDYCLEKGEICTENSYYATEDNVLYKTEGGSASLVLYPSGRLATIYSTNDFSKRYVAFKQGQNDFTINGVKYDVISESSETVVGKTLKEGVEVFFTLKKLEAKYYYDIKVTSIGENAFYYSNLSAIEFGNDLLATYPIRIKGLSYLKLDSIGSFLFANIFPSNEFYPDYVYFPNTMKKSVSGFFGNISTLVDQKYISESPFELLKYTDSQKGDLVYGYDRNTNTSVVLRATRTKEEITIPAYFSIGSGVYSARKTIGDYAFCGVYLKSVIFDAQNNANDLKVGSAIGLVVMENTIQAYFGLALENERYPLYYDMQFYNEKEDSYVFSDQQYIKYGALIYYIDKEENSEILCQRVGNSEIITTDEGEAVKINKTYGALATYYLQNDKVYSNLELGVEVTTYTFTDGIYRFETGGKKYLLVDNFFYEDNNYGFIIYNLDMDYSSTFYVYDDNKLRVEESTTAETVGTISEGSFTSFGHTYTIDGVTGIIRENAQVVGSTVKKIAINGIQYYVSQDDNVYLDKNKNYFVGTIDENDVTLNQELSITEDNNKGKAKVGSFVFYYDGTKVYLDDTLKKEIGEITFENNKLVFNGTFEKYEQQVLHERGNFSGTIVLNGLNYTYTSQGIIYKDEVAVGSIDRNNERITVNATTYYFEKESLNGLCTTEEEQTSRVGTIGGTITVDGKTYYIGYGESLYNNETLKDRVSLASINYDGFSIILNASQYMIRDDILYYVVGEYHDEITLSFDQLYVDSFGLYYNIDITNISIRHKITGGVANLACKSFVLQKVGYHMATDNNVYRESGVDKLNNHVMDLAYSLEKVSFKEKDTLLLPSISSTSLGEKFNKSLLIYVEKGMSESIIYKWNSAGEIISTFSYDTLDGKTYTASSYIIEGKAFYVLVNEDETILITTAGTFTQSDIDYYKSQVTKAGYEVGGFVGTLAKDIGIGDITYNQVLSCEWTPKKYTVYFYIDEKYSFESLDGATKIDAHTYSCEVSYQTHYTFLLKGYDQNRFVLESWVSSQGTVSSDGDWAILLDDATKLQFKAVLIEKKYVLKDTSGKETIVYFDQSYTITPAQKVGNDFIGWYYNETRLTTSTGASLLNWTIVKEQDTEDNTFNIVPKFEPRIINVDLYLKDSEGIVYESCGSFNDKKTQLNIRGTQYYCDPETGRIFSDSLKETEVGRVSESDSTVIFTDVTYYYAGYNVYTTAGSIQLFERSFTVGVKDYSFNERTGEVTNSGSDEPIEGFMNYAEKKLRVEGTTYIFVIPDLYKTVSVKYGSYDYQLGNVQEEQGLTLFAGWKDIDSYTYTDENSKAIRAWDKDSYSFLLAIMPTEVCSAEELRNVLSESMSSSIVLTDDIVLTENDCFGSKDDPYIGVFNGDGHTVTYRYSSSSSDWNGYAGIFAVNDGTIKNVSIKVEYFIINISTVKFGLIGEVEKPVYAGSVCGINNGILTEVNIDMNLMTVLVNNSMLCYFDESELYHVGICCGQNNGSISGKCVYRYDGSTVYYKDYTTTAKQYYANGKTAGYEGNDTWEKNYKSFFMKLGEDNFEGVTVPYYGAITGEDNSQAIMYYKRAENSSMYRLASEDELLVDAVIWEERYTEYYVIEGGEFVHAGNEYIIGANYYRLKTTDELYIESSSEAQTYYMDGMWDENYKQFFTKDEMTGDYVQVEVLFDAENRYYKKRGDIFTDKSLFNVGEGTSIMSFLLQEKNVTE